MDETTQLRAYRTRHVIRPTTYFGEPERVYCGTDEIRIVPRRGGWRHDPDAIKRLVRAVPIGAPR